MLHIHHTLRAIVLAAWALLTMLMCLSAAAQGPPARSGITLLTIDGAIGPASADYAMRGMARAATDGSELIVLQLDTPGGLDTSMRALIKAILASPVPVATYVAPSGARAASAGVYILYASHIAAMAPGTNLGAATPVQVGMMPDPADPATPGKAPDARKPEDGGTSTMTRKQVNDAAAYLRGLAQLRKRNADWAERAVREAVSLPAHDALKLKVIDVVAADIGALAEQLDGKTVELRGQAATLRTKGAPVIAHHPDWRSRVLGAIANPSVALLLMMLGVYGLLFEFMNPGTTIPGVVGAICLLFALYALQLLPVNYVGLALILLGVAFMIGEAFLPSFGALGLGGVIAFASGALILIDTDLPGYGVPLALVALLAVASALLIAAIAGVALKTRRRHAAPAPGDPVGSAGAVVRVGAGVAWAVVQGETWRVTSARPLWPGQAVRVLARNGLVLEVAPLDNKEQGG